MPKPNFFIIGAPKCGTTSLIGYLANHRQVTISIPKEPHYFLTDLPGYRRIRNLDDYEACFSTADEQEQPARIGEASTWYLYSKEAVPNILDYNQDAKIIVMIRNPVDMAESLYKQFVYGLEEDAKTFEEAWKLQPERQAGRSIPKHIAEPIRLQYKDVCSLGSQLHRVSQIVPRDQLKVIVLDDFKSNTKKVYEEVLGFLGLPPDDTDSFPVLNQRKANRYPSINKLLLTNSVLDRLVALIKKVFGIEKLGLSQQLLKLNEKRETGSQLDGKLRRDLTKEFEQEITLLEEWLGRDLTHWRVH
ncbi:sulfotransferase domain-containing protein [Marinobacter sp. SS21]|uniref:sulfotransferase domain-containing protein n=1 Tax=Marinobacter sp. SS21 TaxID=2979460 RepID=UPI00232D404E|nr:sulfotransferase domain-containing protein [Marinobacter sp. SS21]MDC0661943.1 sulfotransferase domain-containing protein [Marinobacter sp. SS21]